MKTQSTHSLEFTQDHLLNSIPRVSSDRLTSDSFAQQFQQPGRPVIITGLLNSGCDWTLEYLTEQLGTQEFLLRCYGKHRYQQDKRQWTSIGSGVPPQSKSFADYAEMLRSHEAHDQDIYLAKCSIHNTPLAATETVQHLNNRLDHLGLTQSASPLNIWVGPAGHVESLHYDPTDGTLIQLHGTKKIVLFPPSQTTNLYPFPFYVHLRYGLKLRCWFSQVYPDRPDFAAFPKLQEALRYKHEIVLNQGEALYIPAGWWHEVTALGDEMVCSVNRFWRVYPIKRAVFSWPRWRAYLGSACAMPNVLFSLVTALFSPQPTQRLKAILQQL
jgi:lysine-specific demethylase 8/hypoxia-inducible factor 1-alpha inhibitor (HIF hydroxylase)